MGGRHDQGSSFQMYLIDVENSGWRGRGLSMMHPSVLVDILGAFTSRGIAFTAIAVTPENVALSQSLAAHIPCGRRVHVGDAQFLPCLNRPTCDQVQTRIWRVGLITRRRQGSR